MDSNSKTMYDLVKAILPRHQSCCTYPSRDQIEVVMEDVLGLIFPEYTDVVYSDADLLEKKLVQAKEDLANLLSHGQSSDHHRQATIFFEALRPIYLSLCKDAEAVYNGDPAAQSIDEVIRTYPGFYAIAAYRMAHQLYLQGVPILPRAIAEIAHSKTGIDIHPGARIGEYFCIDHGSGVVIGETTIVGSHVKVYQGVTLGALSVDKSDADSKRHPTLEDYVVVYAGATILGGDTTVGSHSIIGGNVWLTRSVPSHSKVYYKASIYDEASGTTDLLVIKS